MEEEDECSSRVEHSSNEVEKKLEVKEEEEEHPSSNTQSLEINNDSKKQVEHLKKEEEGDKFQEENEQPSANTQFEIDVQPQLDDSDKAVDGSNLVLADVVDGQEASFPATDDVPAIVAEESPFEHVPVESELQRNVGDTPPTMANEAAHSETAPFDAGDVPSMLDGEVPIGVPPVDTNDTPSVIAPVEAEHTSPVAPVYASIDSPPIDTEEAPSLIAQDTSSIVAEHTSIAPEVAPSMFTVDIPVPSVVVEDTTLVAEDTPSMVAEGAPSMVTEDTPMTVFEDAPSMAATDAPSMVAEETPSIVSKGPPSMIAEMAPPMVAEETPSIVSEGPPSMIAEMAPPMLAEDAPPIVVEEEPSVAGEDSAKVVAEEAPRVAAEDPSPGVNEDASPMDDENASPTAADAVVQVLEVDTEVETETEMVDTEMAMETEAVDTGSSGVQKRKRGRPAKAQAQAQAQAQAKAQPKGAPPSKRMEEEDVCFICFDGGNLVLCDRRACPKAYHPACINRDEAFFRSKGRWNCGWHICSNCQKAAHYMCYTCTYSLCKGCIKEAEFLCVRGNRGFCEACMRTILLIEKNEQPQIDFDDKSSWEYLFKEYWIDLKRKHSITLDELIQAKNPLKGSNTLARNGESSEELYDANDDKGSDSDGSSEHLEVSTSKKPKTRRRLKTSKVEEPPSVTHAVGKITPLSNNAEWASKELLEFVAHMKNGDKSVQTQFDVQALLLDYIKQNNLRDPRKKSQIVCDSRLESLFGKARVGHFEMLKLLELHFLIKEDTQADDNQGTTDTEANQLDGDGSAGVVTKDKRRKSRKKGDGRGPQTNLDDYAAIDVHNIKLLYLRRNLMEDLLEDSEKFHDKVVGAFVRIRISGSGQKQDMYRLVQVAGTRKAAEPYKTGKRLADVVLEILNLNKTEFISIDTISNQEFSEDECKRLRQSIKCGLISRMTVGEVQEKAMALQTVRVSDWLEMEKLRISHLRDRASEQGRRKDLRECVEKLQLLNTPEERFRRLQEIPEVHADPNMDPNYVSEEDEEQDDRSQDKSMMSRDAGFGRKGRDLISPGKGSPASVDTWSGARKSATSGSEPGRNLSTTGVWDRAYGGNGAGESVSDAHHLNNWEKPKDLASATGLGTGASSGQVVGRSGPSPGNPQEPASSLSTGISSNISETDKMWHYQDPSGKIQGPFSMQQLRKWNKTGHFPVDLRIWRTNEKQEDSVLLNDALVGKFTKELPHKSNNFSPPSGNNQELSWGGSTNPALTDRNLIDRMSNSNYIDASVFANDGAQLANSGAQLANSDVWGSGSSSWAAPATDTKKTDVWGPGSSGWAAPATESKKTDVWGGGSSGWAAPATESKKTDVWGGGSSGWAAPTTDSRGEQSGHSFRGGWDSRGNNGWAGRPVHNPQTSSSYYGQPQRPISHARGQGGGRWNHGQSRGNNWNPGRYAGQQSNTGRGGYDKRANNMGPSVQSSGERWRTPENSTKGWGTVEIPKPLTESWDVNQTSNRSNLSNLPSPTPMTSRANWTDQASENKWSPTSSVPSYPANTMPSAAPRMGSNGVPVGATEPNKTASGWGEQQNFPITPATGGWGPSASPGTGSVPTKPAEILNQDGRVDYSSPPTPTPMSAGN